MASADPIPAHLSVERQAMIRKLDYPTWADLDGAVQWLLDRPEDFEHLAKVVRAKARRRIARASYSRAAGALRIALAFEGMYRELRGLRGYQ